MSKTFYVTTPIYYVNDVPHIGHVYTTVASDVLARYRRLMGDEVFFLTGTDEHGQKIEKAAQQGGETPQELADRVVLRFKDLWAKVNISHNDFIRTTEARHKGVVHRLFLRIHEQGDIYKGEYEDWYCVHCETFLTELQLVDDRCPNCARPVERLKEESYFFRMSKYQDRLLEHIKSHPDFIQPEGRRNEVISFIEGGLKDLSISRTGLKWGIPIPTDERHVIYVWFDALANYLTALGYPDAPSFEKFWPADVHLVGKDILRFHAVYWPAFLLAAGLALPKKVFAHGWWTVEGEKMSKSKGNVVNPVEVLEEVGADAFRYFLLREVPFGLDGDYSQKALVNRYNNDLANDLGNLLSRTLKMIQQYADGRIPTPSGHAGGPQEVAQRLPERMEAAMRDLAFHRALGEVWQLVERANQYIEQSAPWNLAKDPSQKERLSSVLYNAAEALRLLSLHLYPFMPETARTMARQLGLDPDRLFEPGTLAGSTQWGKLGPGLPVSKAKALFPRMEPKGGRGRKPSGDREESEGPGKPRIGIEAFAQLDLRAGKILSAEPIPGSNKLLKLMVDIGTERRQVVAGIAAKYKPEDIIGRKVIVVANLKPARLKGVESQGMILAAGDREVEALATFLEDIRPGTVIK